MNSDNANLEHIIEALLFWKGEPLSIKEIAKSLAAKEADIVEAADALEQSLSNRGITLLRKNTIDKQGNVNLSDQELMLGTSKEASTVIEKLTKEELSKDLGKASLETLAIVLYKGPVKRSEIDNIRGVNSTFILRNLLIRGLVDKQPDPRDSRASLYSASFDLMSHLGVSKIEDLPNFAEVKEEIQKFNEHSAELQKPETAAEGEQVAAKNTPEIA